MLLAGGVSCWNSLGKSSRVLFSIQNSDLRWKRMGVAESRFLIPGFPDSSAIKVPQTSSESASNAPPLRVVFGIGKKAKEPVLDRFQVSTTIPTMTCIMRFFRVSVLIWLASVGFFRSPVSASPGPSSFLIRYWLTSEGLPHNSPTKICQARNGDLWIATNAGITRFDGVRFETFSTPDGLPDSEVQALFIDSKKRIWIGTRRGVAVRENGKWRTLGQEWSSSSCRSIAETGDGSMWFGTDSGLCRWKRGKADLLQDTGIRELQAAPDGSLWIIGYTKISRWNNGQVEAIPELNRLIAGRETWGVLPAGEGSWLLFGENLLVKGAGERWENLAEGMPDAEGKHISCVAASDGSLWVATRNRGIACFKNGVWTRIDTNDGLSHDDVRFLLEDQEGNIWACTNGGGLNQVRHRRIEVFGLKEGLGRQVTTSLITDAAGQLWAGTDGGGLKRLEGNTFVPALPENSLLNLFIWALGDDGGGGLWIGTFREGLIHWQNGQFRTINSRDGLLSNWVHGLCRDRAGDLWIGTHNGGIQRLHDGVLLTERGPQGGLPAPVTGFLERRDGELWAYTAGSGILRRIGQQWLPLDGDQGLPNTTVGALHEDGQGRIWSPGAFARQVANVSLKSVWDLYNEQGSEERAIARLERQRIEIITNEEITEGEAKWLTERLGADGRISNNERALLDFLFHESANVHPDLKVLAARFSQAA